MMMRVLHRFTLNLVVSVLALTGLAGLPASAAPSAHKLSPSDNKALLAYQRDLVSVLAPRADALPLLAAALLARPLADQPKVNSFHSLIGRAAQAGGSDAAVDWVRLADCDNKADACPNTAALEKLQTEAPDNAAVWLIKLGVDAHNLKSDDARADLGKAAAASTYDDYTGTSLQALARSVGVLPPPAAAIRQAKGGAIGTQAVLVFSLASLQPQPGLPVVAQLCRNARDDASIKADCLKLAKTLVWGSSPLARSLGLHLQQQLSGDPSSEGDAGLARTNLIWQVQSFNQLLHRAEDDPVLAQQLLALARTGGTEMSLMLASLRQAKLPADAPAGWKPPAAEAETTAK